MLVSILQEALHLGTWKSKQIIRWLNRLKAQEVRWVWAAAAQAFLVIKYLRCQMRAPVFPLVGAPQWRRALPSGCALISCQLLPSICLSLCDIIFIWTHLAFVAGRAKFTDHFLLIAFLSGCFSGCPKRASNSPVCGSPSCSHSPIYSGEDFLFDTWSASGVWIPIRSDQRDPLWFALPLKSHLCWFISLIDAAFNVAGSLWELRWISFKPKTIESVQGP